MSQITIVYGCTPDGDHTAAQSDCTEKMSRTFEVVDEAATFMHMCTYVHNADEARLAIINTVPAELIPTTADEVLTLQDFNEFSINQSIGDSVF